MSLLVTISSSTHGSVLAFSLLLGLLLSVSPPPFQLREKMFYNSAHRKVLRIIGRGRDSPNNNNNEEPEDEYGSVPEHLRDKLLVKNEKYLISNGADLFKELVKSSHGKNNPFRIFSLEELQKATNNFSADLVLRGFAGRTYRGTIEDSHVAVKTRHMDFSLLNEVVSLSLIKHRNVVKLLGCCLETKNLIVVHELPRNATLERYFFLEKLYIPPPLELSWTDRLRIATEIADAVAYLHSELHMTHERLSDSEAVLLDEFHSAKLGAFHHSTILNQAESSDVQTEFRNKFRKRWDVYNFGKLLANLLGEVERFDKVEGSETLNYLKLNVSKILKYLKLNKSEKEMPQIEAYMDLASRCQSSDKPSMEEVAQELRRIRSMINSQPTTNGNDSHNLSSGAN